MNKNFWLYGFLGLISGILATAGILLITIQAAPQSIARLLQPESSAAGSNSLVADRISNLPVPGGMIGQVDRRFIIMMIPHHKDAIAMADLALTRAKHPEIKQLAQTIKTTQTRENQQMASWYKSWYGTEVPTWQPGTGMGMGMGMGRQQRWWAQTQPNPRTPSQPSPAGGMGMGCMGFTDLEALRQASDFDRAFIEQMIPHHEMGVMMAQMALARGQRSEIQSLAKAIIQGQTAEIDQMQQWYQTWYGSTSKRQQS